MRAKLEKVLSEVNADPDYQKVAKEANLPVQFMDSGTYTATLKDLDASFEKLWKTTPWNK